MTAAVARLCVGRVHYAWIALTVAFTITLGAVGVRAGVFTGFNVWLGFILTTILTNYAFSGRKYSLTAIDPIHWLLVLIVMGAIIGWWAV